MGEADNILGFIGAIAILVLLVGLFVVFIHEDKVASAAEKQIGVAKSLCLEKCNGERWLRSFNVYRDGRVECFCKDYEHHY